MGINKLSFVVFTYPAGRAFLASANPISLSQPTKYQKNPRMSRNVNTAQNPKCKHWSEGENMQIKSKDMKEILIGLNIREFASNEILGGPIALHANQ